ncbi:MAG: hypothetical protein KBF76_06705 [Verrucomicrobiales bacterium]|nr:hypothetical protein [Verrucomicrobiales bacterium]
MKNFSSLALLLSLSFFLSGCGGNWIVGKWTLNKELTLEMISAADPPANNAGEGFLKELVTGLQKGVSRILLTQFEGVIIEFTATEMRRVRNGAGEATLYEVIDQPATGTLVLKYESGEIVTWSKVDTGIRMKLPGEMEQWVYFSKVKS